MRINSKSQKYAMWFSWISTAIVIALYILYYFIKEVS